MDDKRGSHRSRVRRWARLGLALLGVLLFLGTLAVVAGRTRDALRQRDRYQFDFSAIECLPAPPEPAQTFLNEVQYEGEMPSVLNLLDVDLGERLAGAFRKHRWVEKVERVEITPSRQVRVELRYRTPVLAVRVGSGLRAVDGYGILLPETAATAGLPVYPGKAAPPGIAGKPWGDAEVEAAARRATP